MNLKKFLQLSEWSLSICLVMLQQAVFAQDSGYWDDRFSAKPSSDIDSFIQAIVVTDNGEIYASGSFLGSALIKWNGTGWSSLGGSNGSVYALVRAGNDLYIGGGFTTIGGIQANNIAKYNLVNKTWSALGSEGNNGTDHIVRAIAVQGNSLYAGGFFRKAGGKRVNYIAKYNTVTNVWTRLGDGLGKYASVDAIVVKNGEVYVGGGFSTAGGVPANNIANGTVMNGYL